MRKLLASCSVLLLAGGLLAACGSSGSSKPSSNTTKPGNSSDSGSSSDISQLYADGLKQKFKITYDSGGGDTQTYAEDGKGNTVYGSSDSQYFTTPNGSFSCNTGSDGKAECTDTPGAGVATNGFLGLYNAGKTFVTALAAYGDKSTKSIAGRDADCVTFSAKSVADKGGAAAAAIAAGLKGSATYCVDKGTGVLLEVSGTDSGGKATTSFEVTKFEEPSASDFTPPATPKTAPSVSLPAGITLPPGVTYPSGITIPGGG